MWPMVPTVRFLAAHSPRCRQRLIDSCRRHVCVGRRLMEYSRPDEPHGGSMSSLKGKTALVTGGSRGIGRGIALRLAQRGASVAINYVRDEGAATETLQAIRSMGADGFIVRADVSAPDEISAIAGRVQQEFGKLEDRKRG